MSDESPTIRDVSRRAQVSVSTVSRVLNGIVPVADQTRQRVLQAVKELGYRPNAFARSLVTNRSNAIGVVVNDMTSPFYSGMLRGVEQELHAAGYYMLPQSGHADIETERRALDFLQQRRVDALVIHVESIADEELLELMMGEVPVILVARQIAEANGKCVYSDNELGGRVATQYLIDQGHTCIAHLTGPLHFPDSRARLQGYRQALEQSGLGFDDALVIESDWLEEGGYSSCLRLMKRRPDITAIFAGNDQMAAGVLQALRDLGKSIPEDISVMGYDDVLFARYLYPSLTTVRQPLQAMGASATRLVLAALNSEEVEVQQKFEPELIIRQSVSKR